MEGYCDPRFAEVEHAFRENFEERGEIGASLCVSVDGVPLVDLWGGFTDRQKSKPWQRDTIGVIWSCTKGAVALCAHWAIDRGLLELDKPVGHYWPSFSGDDRGDIPVRWFLDHQAGLPALRHPIPSGGLFCWDVMTSMLEKEPLFWTPGTRQGYHAPTFGHLVGELVQRVTAKPLGSFFREEIAGPRGLDFHLGLPASEEHRVAPVIRPDPIPPGEVPWRFLTEANKDPNSIQSLIIRNTGRAVANPDSPDAHAAVLPSQGAISNARGLAGLYQPLALGGDGLVGRDSITRMAEVSSATACDAVLLVGMRFSLGFMKSSDNRSAGPGQTDSIILSPTAFGHAGMGGSLGFADPAHRLAFGYTMNKQGRGVLLNARGQSLVDAAYRSLGCRSCDTGFWI